MTDLEWEEVKNTTELAKVKSVYEMMPTFAEKNLRWGRPKLTEEHFSIVENCLRLDFTIWEACDAAWISVSAYYRYYNTDADFALRMDRAKDFPKMMARTAVMKRIRQWDAKTALRYLELRDKKRYNTDTGVKDDDDTREEKAPVVQFISVASNEWAENDWQTSTEPKSASEWYVSSWESEKLTPWENEDRVLKNIASTSSSVG